MAQINMLLQPRSEVPANALTSEDLPQIMKYLQSITCKQVVMYHKGHLAYDRGKNREVDKIGLYTLQLARHDPSLVDLVQYQLGQGKYSYAAIGRNSLKNFQVPPPEFPGKTFTSELMG